MAEKFFVVPLTMIIRNFDFFILQLFLDASILAAMAIKILRGFGMYTKVGCVSKEMSCMGSHSQKKRKKKKKETST